MLVTVQRGYIYRAYPTDEVKNISYNALVRIVKCTTFMLIDCIDIWKVSIISWWKNRHKST